MYRRRILFTLVLAGVAVAAIGARCIENVGVWTDDSGYTYLLGEIANDTDIHGSGLVLQATLYDAAGGTIASKNVDVMCPADLAPKSLSAYGVRFNEPNLPPYASFSVRPVGGTALEQPLPKAAVTIADQSAVFTSDEDVQVTFKVRNNGSKAFSGIKLCSTTYDLAGRVRQVSPVDPSMFHADVVLDPGQTTDLSFSLWGQGGASAARVWLTFPGAGKAFTHQSIMSESIPIAQ